MAGKTFKRAVRKDKIWFTMPDAKDTDVRYDCVDILPAGVILDFGTSGDDAADSGNSLDKVKEFFDAAVMEDQHEQFWAQIHDPKARIGIEMLVDIAEYIAEEFTARPTGESSPDGPPTTSTGDGSTDGALRAVPTYSRPEPIVASTS